jgi:hypothetical protein
MPFRYDRPYWLYVLLGDPNHPPLWSWKEWSATAPLLDPLLAKARGPAAVRSLQFQEDGKTPVNFGRIGWNDRGHRKWTHESPDTRAFSASWKFLSAEVWAPSRQQSTKEGDPPDLFVAFRNEAYWEKKRLQFNPFLLLAFPRDGAPELVAKGEHAASGIASRLKALLVARQSRPWGLQETPGGFYSRIISDMMASSPFRPGPLHEGPPSLGLLEGSWERIG